MNTFMRKGRIRSQEAQKHTNPTEPELPLRKANRSITYQ
jgi:hypothetical protein